jgi:CPA1 family monovalent cation:H+ antiporter
LLLVGTALATARLVPAFSVQPEIVLAVFLPALLFDAGFSMRAAAVRREVSWILLLGLLGTILAAATVFALLRLASFPSEEALLLAAILAATDPVSVFAALRRLHTPERLRVALEGESLVNDGLAVVLFAVALSIVGRRAAGAADVIGLFLFLSAAGLLVGVVIGLVARWLMDRTPTGLQIAISVVCAYAAYLLADAIHGSGLLAVIAMSLILGNAYQPSSHHLVHRFWRQLGFLMSSVVFLLVGLQVRLDAVWRVGGRLLILVVAMLASRALMVLLITAWRGDLWPWAWRLGLVWAGLRGALSLALALSVPPDVAAQPQVLALAFGFIFLSLAIQGLSTGPVFSRLGITRQTAVKSVR